MTTNNAGSKKKLHDIIGVEMFATQYMSKPIRGIVGDLNFAALGLQLWTYQKLSELRSDLLAQGQD